MFRNTRPRRRIDITTPIDWKNSEWLRQFVTDSGRMLPRRLTGNNRQRQRELARAIKRARHIVLLPFSGSG